MYKEKGIVSIVCQTGGGNLCTMKKACIVFATMLSVVVMVAFSGTGDQKDHQYATNGVAIDGYDAVAYFTDHKALKGSSGFITEWNGVSWYFASAGNKALFDVSPITYAPQYGGYCAFGASKGYKAPTDPTAWTIVGDKLYLNYSHKVKETWLRDTADRIKKADIYWISLIQK